MIYNQAKDNAAIDANYYLDSLNGFLVLIIVRDILAESDSVYLSWDTNRLSWYLKCSLLQFYKAEGR